MRKPRTTIELEALRRLRDLSTEAIIPCTLTVKRRDRRYLFSQIEHYVKGDFDYHIGVALVQGQLSVRVMSYAISGDRRTIGGAIYVDDRMFMVQLDLSRRDGAGRLTFLLELPSDTAVQLQVVVKPLCLHVVTA